MVTRIDGKRYAPSVFTYRRRWFAVAKPPREAKRLQSPITSTKIKHPQGCFYFACGISAKAPSVEARIHYGCRFRKK